MYDQNKDLMKKLLDIFNKMSETENTDRDKDLANNLSTFIKIYENADYIIEKNDYNSIKFYGVLFCYFNYYDKDNLMSKSKVFRKCNNKHKSIFF
jgi:hypothetical protein